MTEPVTEPSTGLEPGFHAARGWLNDPHGVAFHDGRYHLFFQHVPDSLTWRTDISWGHAVSDDLEHWSELPVALAPDDDDLGCWSGCLVVGPDGPTIYYTSVSGTDHDLGRIRAARPLDDGWLRWRKHDVPLDRPDDVVAFRDPFVLRDGDSWRMLVGAGLREGVAAVVSYRSRDLVGWTYAGVLARRPSTETAGAVTGSIWECPQLVDVNGVATLVVSVHDGSTTRHVAYSCGGLVDGRFEAGPWRQLTGGAPYAATTFTDAEGRLVMLFWLRDVADERAGWAGALSAPYLVSRDGDRLVLERRPVRG